MSLIQEALRRQREEAARAMQSAPAPAGGGVPPPAPHPAEERPASSGPPPVPPPVTVEAQAASPQIQEEAPEPRREKSRPGVLVAVIVGGIAVLAVGVFGVWQLRNPRPRTPETPAVPPSPPPASSQPPAAPPAVSNAPATATSAVTPMSHPPQLSDERPSEKPVTLELSVPARVEWPKLTLTAAMGRGAVGSVTIIDSASKKKIYSVGDTVDGVRIVAIGEGGVYLEYKGEKQFLRVGNSLP